MSSPLAGAVGERMELADYYADFEQTFWAATSFWKLERAQTFAEPGNASWEAFDRGDWNEALRLLEAELPAMRERQKRIAAAGFMARRVRIVEFPITPYLQWELHSLAIRDECGGPVRVLPATEIAAAEADEALPEITTVGEDVLYQAVYDDSGVLAAVYRFSDREVIRRCRELIVGLFEEAEPLAEFFGCVFLGGVSFLGFLVMR